MQNWVLETNSIQAISNVVQLDVDEFGVAYGFEVVVGGETIPFIFASEEEANFYYDKLYDKFVGFEEEVDLDDEYIRNSN